MYVNNCVAFILSVHACLSTTMFVLVTVTVLMFQVWFVKCSSLQDVLIVICFENTKIEQSENQI